MISEIINSLFLTYLASEYLISQNNQYSPGTIRTTSSTIYNTYTTIKQRITILLAGIVLIVNIIDRLIGLSNGFHLFLDNNWILLFFGGSSSSSYYISIVFKATLAATCYVMALYIDINRNAFFFSARKKNKNEDDNTRTSTTSKILPFSIYISKVGWAFLKILPAYPFLAVLISFMFLFVINIWEFFNLPLEWLNDPIYYCVLYGPFAYTYVHVKNEVIVNTMSIPT